MLELRANLVRADSGTFATGEVVECVIEFANSTATENSGGPQTLAWASCQLQCYRKTSYSIKSKKQDKTNEISMAMAKTSLDTATPALGDIIIETKPKILFCDLTLEPGENRKYFFVETIPRDGPPTYSGKHDIRYFYRITIATQRVMSKVQSLVVPIRVLPIPIFQRPDDVPCTEETNEDLAPTNPFLEREEPTELEVSWDHLKNITARRSPKYYRITNKHGFVACFGLFKHLYKLGEDIIGSLDFTDRTVRCVQFSVKLQSEEIDLHNISSEKSDSTDGMNESSSVKSDDFSSVASGSVDDKRKSSTSGSAKEQSYDGLTGKISTYTRNHQICYAIVKTHISVPIPLDVTPTFRTDLVDVRWRLHFEFVTSTMFSLGEHDSVTGTLNAPAEIPVETMVWDLPITIYATNPLQIFSPRQDHCVVIK